MIYQYRPDLALQAKSLTQLIDPPEGHDRDFLASVMWEFCADGELRFGWKYDHSEQAFWLFRSGKWYLLAGVTPDDVAHNLAKAEPELDADKGCGLLSEVVWQWRQRNFH